MTTKEKVQLHPFEQTQQYFTIKRRIQDEACRQDSGDLPYAMEALAMLGEVKENFRPQMVSKVKLDGSIDVVMDPYDALFYGEVSVDEAANFLERCVRTLITPPRRDPNGKGAKDIFVAIWYQRLPEFKAIFHDAYERTWTIKDHFKRSAYASPELIREFKDCRGDAWNRFAEARTEINREVVGKVKVLAKNVAQEMKLAVPLENAIVA